MVAASAAQSAANVVQAGTKEISSKVLFFGNCVFPDCVWLAGIVIGAMCSFELFL